MDVFSLVRLWVDEIEGNNSASEKIPPADVNFGTDALDTPRFASLPHG